MKPIWAIVERDLRKFFRSPALITVSLFLPLLQLVIIGYSVGGQVRNISVAMVILDRGPEALELRQKLRAVEANSRTFRLRLDADMDEALEATRNGRVAATIVVPENYSAKRLSGDQPQLGLIMDNTDPFVVSSLSAKMTELIGVLNRPEVDPRHLREVTLELVELYPYVAYVEYLLAGSITLAVFVSVMVGGGLLYIDDKSRGFHEGYLVTPITKFQLVAGMALSGTTKAAFSGFVVTLFGSLIAGVWQQFSLESLLLLLLLNILIAMALTSMISLMMVRVSDPHIPRATFGVLNTLLFFPSGAMYPVDSFPPWLRAISTIDPFTYAVHGLRAVLLKNVGFDAIVNDVLFLFVFSIICFLATLILFRRRY